MKTTEDLQKVAEKLSNCVRIKGYFEEMDAPTNDFSITLKNENLKKFLCDDTINEIKGIIFDELGDVIDNCMNKLIIYQGGDENED